MPCFSYFFGLGRLTGRGICAWNTISSRDSICIPKTARATCFISLKSHAGSFSFAAYGTLNCTSGSVPPFWTHYHSVCGIWEDIIILLLRFCLIGKNRRGHPHWAAVCSWWVSLGSGISNENRTWRWTNSPLCNKESRNKMSTLIFSISFLFSLYPHIIQHYTINNSVSFASSSSKTRLHGARGIHSCRTHY